MTTDAGQPPETEIGPHEHEPHGGGTYALLNWLRAAVLGANDGIVSTAGLVDGRRRRHHRPQGDLRRRGSPGWSRVR